MKKIGIQGNKGSFSEVAANNFARSNEMESFELDYLISSEKVLAAVESKAVDIGIFAMENSCGGVVLESVKALAKHQCRILDMFHIPISQNLLTLKGNSIDTITEVHSHRQALRQCRDFLTNYFWGLPLIEEDDTAEAARRLSTGELSKTTAVIANIACAELYDLEILQKDIHDLKNNLTLFLAVSAI
jgi:prephenate dehydratase